MHTCSDGRQQRYRTYERSSAAVSDPAWQNKQSCALLSRITLTCLALRQRQRNHLKSCVDPDSQGTSASARERVSLLPKMSQTTLGAHLSVLTGSSTPVAQLLPR